MNSATNERQIEDDQSPRNRGQWSRDRQPPRPGYPAQHGKLRLLTLEALDGRTLAAQRAKQLVGAIEQEIRCGDDDEPLTVKQQQFAMHAAFLGAMIENIAARWLIGETVDLQNYALLINAQRRVLEEL